VIEAQWTQRESELTHERMEIRQMAVTFKQASEDLTKMIDEERAKAQLEIESAHAATLRVEAALEQQAQSLSAAEQGVKVVTAITLLLHTLFLETLIFLFNLKTWDTCCGPFPSMNIELLPDKKKKKKMMFAL
jgi:hypothetical protein